MEMLQIAVKKRDSAGTRATRKLRGKGYLPAVIYGHGDESLSVALPESEMRIFFRQKVRILDLDVEGKAERAIVKNIQYDPLGRSIIHLDLLRIRLDEVISVSVPVKIVGVAKGVEEGGIQEILRNDIQVKCLPTQIPEAIEVNVSGLGVQESLHMKDLKLPEGVELEEDPDYAVVSIVVRAKEVEPEPAEVEEAEEVEGAEGEESKEGDEPKDKKSKEGDEPKGKKSKEGDESKGKKSG